MPMKRNLFRIRRIILRFIPAYPKRLTKAEIFNRGQELWEETTSNLTLKSLYQKDNFDVLYEFQSRVWKLNSFDLYSLIEHIKYEKNRIDEENPTFLNCSTSYTTEGVVDVKIAVSDVISYRYMLIFFADAIGLCLE